jgi:carboxypeptidase C (cathepsin A)
LGYQTDRYYNTLSFDVGRDWTYRSKQGKYTNTGEDLASALKDSRYIKVFSASGIYDLIVPYDEVLFELHQMDIPPAIASNLQAKSYPGGHMPYLDKIARKQLVSDQRIFYKGADELVFCLVNGPCQERCQMSPFSEIYPNFYQDRIWSS